MTPQEHVAQLKAEEDRTFRWLTSLGHRRCGLCGESADNPGQVRGDAVLLCDFCRPYCEHKGCRKPALMGGEGGCEQHELEIWAEFHELVDAVGGAA